MYIGESMRRYWETHGMYIQQETRVACYWVGLNRLPDADKPLTATLTAPTAPSCHTSGVNPLKSCFAPTSR
jgi:hypothetical protein